MVAWLLACLMGALVGIATSADGGLAGVALPLLGALTLVLAVGIWEMWRR